MTFVRIYSCKHCGHLFRKDDVPLWKKCPDCGYELPKGYGSKWYTEFKFELYSEKEESINVTN